MGRVSDVILSYKIQAGGDISLAILSDKNCKKEMINVLLIISISNALLQERLK